MAYNIGGGNVKPVNSVFMKWEKYLGWGANELLKIPVLLLLKGKDKTFGRSFKDKLYFR